jgi:DNA-binding transcriptional LysR family regulator
VVKQPDSAPPVELTVGTRFELGLSWLVPSLSILEKRRPTWRLHLYFGDTPDLLQRLRRAEVDCVVTSARLTQAGLEMARLYGERYVLVGQSKALARHPLGGPADARQHTLLDLHPDLPLFRYFLDSRPGDEAWRFARVQHLGTIAAVRARLLEGAGIAVLPAYFVYDDLRRKRLRVLLPRTRLPMDWFRLVWSQGTPHGEVLRELAAELMRCAPPR